MLELITVVFEPELPLLKIQAQSIQQHVNNVGCITVVVNDHDRIVHKIDCNWWGPLCSLVRVVPKSKWNYQSRINGWEEQQLLKLLAAGESAMTWSMVLDAKTWFVQSFDNLFDPQGRPRTGAINVFPVFESSQKFVERYYNIAMPRVLGPAGVPFLFHTDTVRNLVDSVSDFPEFFQTNVRYPNLVTEFHLYSGFVLSQCGTYDKLYNLYSYYNVLNIADWEADNFDHLLETAKSNPKLLTASIHRRTYKLLSPSQIQQWVDFLVDNKIVTNEKETVSLLNTFVT